jgi:hypothetical protein
MSIPDRILAELIAFDRSANAVLGGDIEQTISARAFAVELAEVDSFWRIAIDRLFGEGHCRAAWESEMERLARQEPLPGIQSAPAGERP